MSASEFLIPEYWLTGLGSWAVSYLLHSSVILGGVLLLTHFISALSESHKDVLLKIGLLAGILTASVQFIQSSNGVAVSTIAIPLQQNQAADTVENDQLGRILSSQGLQLLIPQQRPALPGTNQTEQKIDWLKVILLCWSFGILLFGMRFLWLWRRFNAHTGERKPVTDQNTLDLCERLRQKVAIKRPIRLTCSERIASPMAIGLSQICIPDKLWEQVDEEQLTAIIAHELAHLSRTDPLWLFFWHLMGVVFFFQPLNKLAQLSFQSRAEFLADATAVRQTKDPVAMVNSLMSAAKLVNSTLRSNMAAHLLGSNASLMARAQMLLAENPQKTKTPLPLILLIALLVVSISAYWLPSVSLTRHAHIGEMPKYGELNADNALPWTQFSDTRLNFESNIDFSHSIAGAQKIMRTRRVTFDYELDGIAAIKAFGQLRFASQTIYSTKYLVIESDYQNKVWYQYKVDGELIDDQVQALDFMRWMLNSNFAEDDEFKRKMMRMYIVQGTNDQAWQIAQRFQLFLDKPQPHLTEQDLSVVRTLQQQAPLLVHGSGEKADSSLHFFNAMAHSGDNMASFNDFGFLAISSKTRKPGSLSIQYNLNDHQLLELFAEANGADYVPGETEKALVHFLVRLHFKVPQSNIRWFEEQAN